MASTTGSVPQESIWALVKRLGSEIVTAVTPPWWVMLIFVVFLYTACFFLIHYQYNKMVAKCMAWRTVLLICGTAMYSFKCLWEACQEFGFALWKVLKYGLVVTAAVVYGSFLFGKAIVRNVFYAPDEPVVKDQPETYFSPSLVKTMCENNLLPPTCVYAQPFLLEKAKKAQMDRERKQDQEAAQRSNESLRQSLFSAQSGVVHGKGGTKRKSEISTSGLPDTKKTRKQVEEEFIESLPKSLKLRKYLLTVLEKNIKDEELEDTWEDN